MKRALAAALCLAVAAPSPAATAAAASGRNAAAQPAPRLLLEAPTTLAGPHEPARLDLRAPASAQEAAQRSAAALPALESAGAVANPSQDAAPPTAETQAGRWTTFWSGSAAKAAEPPAPLGRETVSLPSSALSPAVSSRGHAVMPAVIFGGSKVMRWADHIWAPARPFAEFGAILAGTYLLHRAVRWVIDRAASRGRWDPNTIDNARFIGTIVSWALGLGAGLYLAGASTSTVLTTFGVALTLAVKTTVNNVLQAVIFLTRRPFTIGEPMRIGDTLYQVEDMQTQYVRLKVLAKLLQDQPAKAPDGFDIVPLSSVDPLGRAIDEKGNKFAQVRRARQADGKTITEAVRYSYTLLAGKMVTLYRPYTDRPRKVHLALTGRAFGVKAIGRRLAAALRTLPARGRRILEALKALPPRPSLLAAVWLAAAIALVPLGPLVSARLGLIGAAWLFPYLHAAVTLLATRAACVFANQFIPAVASRLGWSAQAAVVVRLIAEAALAIIGAGVSLRAGGKDWRWVGTSLGLSATAMAFISADILGNIADGFILRWSRPFSVNAYLAVGDNVGGVVHEMNVFHVVLKPADKMHALVPYSVIDANELHTLETTEPPAAAPGS